MSFVGDLPLQALDSEAGPGSWSSSASMYRFVWAVKRRCLSYSALHAVLGRAALAMWIGGLDFRDFREGASLGTPIGDERMLD